MLGFLCCSRSAAAVLAVHTFLSRASKVQTCEIEADVMTFGSFSLNSWPHVFGSLVKANFWENCQGCVPLDSLGEAAVCKWTKVFFQLLHLQVLDMLDLVKFGFNFCQSFAFYRLFVRPSPNMHHSSVFLCRTSLWQKGSKA